MYFIPPYIVTERTLLCLLIISLSKIILKNMLFGKVFPAWILYFYRKLFLNKDETIPSAVQELFNPSIA